MTKYFMPKNLRLTPDYDSYQANYGNTIMMSWEYKLVKIILS